MSAVIDLTKKELTKSEVLYGVSWEMYESLVQKYWNMPTPRLTYDSGILEIEMSNSSQHEIENRTLARLAEHILLELEIDFLNCGSTTFSKESSRKGFEPDSSFYIESLDLIEGKTDLDFENDPSPDLIIEINRKSSSLPRMPIFAVFGVKEIWRCNEDEVRFYELVDGVYLETENSICLQILKNEDATNFLLESRKLKSTAWIKKIREWTSEKVKSKK